MRVYPPNVRRPTQRKEAVLELEIPAPPPPAREEKARPAGRPAGGEIIFDLFGNDDPFAI
jgi:hypothetical protein